MMNECFTWFPYKWFRRTQYITSIGLFFNVWGFLTGWYWGVFFSSSIISKILYSNSLTISNTESIKILNSPPRVD